MVSPEQNVQKPSVDSYLQLLTQTISSPRQKPFLRVTLLSALMANGITQEDAGGALNQFFEATVH